MEMGWAGGGMGGAGGRGEEGGGGGGSQLVKRYRLEFVEGQLHVLQINARGQIREGPKAVVMGDKHP